MNAIASGGGGGGGNYLHLLSFCFAFHSIFTCAVIFQHVNDSLHARIAQCKAIYYCSSLTLSLFSLKEIRLSCLTITIRVPTL